ncbi:MAG TPA: AAA-like domain-containing protein [Bacillota bacterium]|nr:AAA-like domain-containing protein [Bacillota bacterium]
MKKFNVTGLCVPEKHYMVDIKAKIAAIVKMVDEGSYFTINRPRQYGKTTTLQMLSRILKKDYLVIDTSFEGVGDTLFETEEKFCSEILALFGDSVEFINEELALKLRHAGIGVKDFNSLSRAITSVLKELEKEIVLIIDEVDKSSANRVFMQFLGLLRNKYLAMNAGKDITFKSVILGGVHDIKNLKQKIRDEKNKVFNSPWNVAADFRVEMSFSAAEIETMLAEYMKVTGTSMDTGLIAEEIRRFTGGYPYLVSRLCKNIDEYLDKNWSRQGVEDAVKMSLNEKSTLFDDVIKNMENNPDLKGLIYEILVEGKEIPYHPIVHEKGIMYGILLERNGKLSLHNRIFESLIYDYLLAQEEMRAMAARLTNAEKSQLFNGAVLNMEKVLLKFQEFMNEQYRQEEERFYETNGRLIFLAYLKPVLNGRGFSFVEAQTRENRRMDVVITYGAAKFVVELKIWNGQKHEDKGLRQLTEYLEIQSLQTGYMLIFNFNKNKTPTARWLKVDEKDVFEVIV